MALKGRAGSCIEGHRVARSKWDMCLPIGKSGQFDSIHSFRVSLDKIMHMVQILLRCRLRSFEITFPPELSVAPSEGLKGDV